jgi:hypothetical protein
MKTTLLCLVLLSALAAGSAHAATRSCGMLAVGPGALRHGSAGGPACLLRAYRSCSAATFTLSSFGVDTVAMDVFRIARASGGCRVDVSASFRVVPQHARLQSGLCRAVRRVAGDVVAVGCSGGLPAPTISLTGRH